MLRLLLISLTLFLGLPALAGQEVVRPFVSGSLEKIVAQRQGKPFILSLWSVSCAHCPEELRALGKLKAAHPRLNIVLVATDDPEDTTRAVELARSFGLGNVQQWIFSDAMPERLRFEIDRRWHGELPRTYLYDSHHKVEAVSGVIPPARLAKWVKENVQ